MSTNTTSAKEILKKIKQMFSDMPMPGMTPAPSAPTTKTVKTTDGVEIVVDKLEVGGTAIINGVAAPANTYTLEDGSSITTDATGKITAYNPPVANPAPAQTPNPAPAQTQQAAPAPVPVKMVAQEKFNSAECEALFAKFATGTPEERIANLELVCKCLMEYNFGYEMRQAKEKADRDAAIAIYTNELATVQTQMKSQKDIVTEIVSLVEQFIAEPQSSAPGSPEKNKKFSFASLKQGHTEEAGQKKNGKTIDNYLAAAKKLAEKNAEKKN